MIGCLYTVIMKMENYQNRVNTVIQVHTDCSSDRKSRFWQIDNQPIPNSEVICPKPQRSTGLPYSINAVNRTDPKAKGSIFPVYRVDCSPEIHHLILGQDDHDNDPDLSNQAGFYYGSPPVRTNNPIIHDVEFNREAKIFTCLGSSPGLKQVGRIERGSPRCCSGSLGGSPESRIEGFACGSPGESCAGFSLA